MKMIKALVAIASAGVLFGASSAIAGPSATLYITDGSTSVTITDGGSGDACPLAGCVTWVGSIGGWSIVVSTGQDLGGGGGIDLNSVATGVGDLTIQFGDSGFTLGPGTHTASLVSSIGGTISPGGSLTALSCVNDNNVQPAGGPCQQTGGAMGPFGPGAFSGAVGWTTSVTDTFALGQQVVIHHDTFGTSSYDAELRVVPEPASLALVGLALALLGWTQNRRYRNRG